MSETKPLPLTDAEETDLRRYLADPENNSCEAHSDESMRRVLTTFDERIKTLQGDLAAAIVNEREAEEKVESADHFILPVAGGLPGEIDVCSGKDGHSHHYIPSSTVETMRTTLLWYADGGNHAPPGHSAEGWCRDSGHRARLALGLPSRDG